MNHYPHHLGDYLKATIGLSMVEDGAYRRLIDVYYDTERPIPLELAERYRLARATTGAERKAVDFVLARYFKECPDGYHLKRCDEEIARYRDKAAKASASASERWRERDANASPDAMPTHSERNAKAMLAINQNQNQEPEVGKLREIVANPGVDVGVSNSAPGANGTDAHGEVSHKAKAKTAGQKWSDPMWVLYTARRLGIDRPQGITDRDFADKVISIVRERQRISRSEAENRRAQRRATVQPPRRTEP